MRLSNEAFAELFTDFKETAFRWESLPIYRVAEEAEKFQSFISGKPTPVVTDSDRAWRDGLTQSKREGKNRSRVRLVPSPPTPYFRCQLQWAYPYNWDAGEKILMVTEEDLKISGLEGHPLLERDFWFFDEKTVVAMEYDESGKYLGASMASDAVVSGHTDLVQRLFEVAAPLPDFLSGLRTGRAA